MQTINLQTISKLISAKLGQSFTVEKIEKAGSGFHSDGFKLTTREGKLFFLKRVKSHEGGFEFPERRISSLLVSDGMAKRSGLMPRPVGVIVANKDKSGIAMDVSEESTIYHVQEFEVAKEDYLDKLKRKENKWKVDEEDKLEIVKIIDIISVLHTSKHSCAKEEILDAVYNDSIRNIIIHPELTFALLHDFPLDDPFLPVAEHHEYIGLMWRIAYAYKNRHERLRALHGDFWGANVLFKEDDSVFLIDFSRIPWGDPGIDVGWWVSQYLWHYHNTGNPYFKELGEEFLAQYIERTKDVEIRKAMCLSLGFLGIVNIYPKFYPEGLDQKIGKAFLGAVKASLEKGEFVWEA